MNHKVRWLTPAVALSLFALSGCGSDDAEGDAVGSCNIVDLGDGTSAIRCPDGSELVVHNGKDGRDGTDGRDGDPGAKGDPGDKGDPGEKGEDAACTLEEVDGAHVLTCGDKSVVLGDACTDGFPFDLVVEADDDASAKLLVLFQATSCTWVRGDVEVYDGAVAEFPHALRRLEKVDGNLVFSTEGIEELSLPRLVEVGGDFASVGSKGLESVELPSLTRLGGVYVSDAADLESLSFPSLETIDGDVYVSGNAKLSNVSVPLLAIASGSFQFQSGNERLVTLEFPALKQAGRISLHGEKLESISFPSLETAVGIQMHSTGLVTTDGFPSLATVGEWLTIDYNPKLKEVKSFGALERVGALSISDNASLESVADFPVLEEITGSEGFAGFVLVADNPALTSFGSLGSVSKIEGDVAFERNEELLQSDIDALLDGIEITGDVRLCGNKGGDAC